MLFVKGDGVPLENHLSPLLSLQNLDGLILAFRNLLLKSQVDKHPASLLRPS